MKVILLLPNVNAKVKNGWLDVCQERLITLFKYN